MSILHIIATEHRFNNESYALDLVVWDSFGRNLSLIRDQKVTIEMLNITKDLNVAYDVACHIDTVLDMDQFANDETKKYYNLVSDIARNFPDLVWFKSDLLKFRAKQIKDKLNDNDHKFIVVYNGENSRPVITCKNNFFSLLQSYCSGQTYTSNLIDLSLLKGCCVNINNDKTVSFLIEDKK